MSTSSKLQQLGSVFKAGFKLAAAHFDAWSKAPEKVPDTMGKIYRSGMTSSGNAFEVRSAVIETGRGNYQLFQITREMQAFSVIPKSDDQPFSPNGSVPLLGWVVTAQVPLNGNTRIFESKAEAIAMRKVYDDETPDSNVGMSPRAI